MHPVNTKRYLLYFILISLAISVLIHFESIMGMWGLNGHPHELNDLRYSPLNVLSELLITTLVAFCAFILNYYLIKPFSGFRKTGFKQIILAIVLTMFSVIILTEVLFSLNRMIEGRPAFSKSSNLIYTFRDLFVGIVVLTGIYVIKSINDRQLALIENERLNRENLESQYESLKNQVSPHFLFNSLTTLKTLINSDPENARRYLDHLSRVLRNTLQTNANPSICLSDELEVVRSYVFLINMRYGKNLVLDFEIDEKFSRHRVPPLSVQTLIENAIKHNEISKRNPLHIRVCTEDPDRLVIRNNLNKKLSTEPGTGIGLSNLSRQYMLLSGKEIIIKKNLKEFTVELPLLTPEPDERGNR